MIQKLIEEQRMKFLFNITVSLMMISAAYATSIPIYDFNSDDIRRSHKVRKALKGQRFSVQRMNQFAETAHFAAISRDCVALVVAKHDRYRPHPPQPRPPHPWPPHRPPFFLGDVENGPEPVEPPITHHGDVSSSQQNTMESNALPPEDTPWLGHRPSLRIRVTQVVCHNGRGVRPIPRPVPLWNRRGDAAESFHGSE